MRSKKQQKILPVSFRHIYIKFDTNGQLSTRHKDKRVIVIYQPFRCMEFIFHNSGRRGRDRMVVGFTTPYAISAYHH